MQTFRSVSAFVAAAAVVAAIGSVHAADPATAKELKTASKATATVSQLATLKGVKAVPMAASELDKVRGLHVHFVAPSSNDQYGVEGLHLAGDVETKNNWSNEWGGSDGIPVAPSYHGLCKATGLSGPGNSVLFIPGGGTQCPL